MTTDTEIDPRAAELYELCLARTCDLLQCRPTQAAMMFIELASDTIDRPATTPPPNAISFKHKPAQLESQPGQQLFVPLRF